MRTVGKPYEGERTTDGLKGWLQKREYPSAVEMKEDNAENGLAEEVKFTDLNSSIFPEETSGSGFRMVAKVVKESARAKAYLKDEEAGG